jgi:hypothetical protein
LRTQPQYFYQEQDFPQSKLLQHGSRTPKELLSGVPFPDAPAEFREDCSSRVLEPCWSGNFFPHLVSCDEIALQKICSSEKSRAKTHLDGGHFKKFLYANNFLI